MPSTCDLTTLARRDLLRTALLGGIGLGIGLGVPRSAGAQTTLSPDVRDHEPDVALYGTGDDGLDLVRTLLKQAPSRLAPEGVLLMEFGFAQGDAVGTAASATPGLQTLEVLRDLQGHERTLVAIRAEAAV